MPIRGLPGSLRPKNHRTCNPPIRPGHLPRQAPLPPDEPYLRRRDAPLPALKPHASEPTHPVTTDHSPAIRHARVHQ